MSIKCKIGLHSWDGCKCSECEKMRDEQHKWNGCKCYKCGRTRDEQHDWNIENKKCFKCGKRMRASETYYISADFANRSEYPVDVSGYRVKETFTCRVCHKLVAQRYTNFGYTPHGTACINCGSIICNHCIPEPNRGAIMLSLARAPLCPFCHKPFHKIF